MLQTKNSFFPKYNCSYIPLRLTSENEPQIISRGISYICVCSTTENCKIGKSGSRKSAHGSRVMKIAIANIRWSLKILATFASQAGIRCNMIGSFCGVLSYLHLSSRLPISSPQVYNYNSYFEKLNFCFKMPSITICNMIKTVYVIKYLAYTGTS